MFETFVLLGFLFVIAAAIEYQVQRKKKNEEEIIIKSTELPILDTMSIMREASKESRKHNNR